MDERKQHFIQEGTKVYVKTRHSNMTLLCTVIMLDNYYIKVKLPCTINGNDTDVVNIKDITVVPPPEQQKPNELPPNKRPEDNPYRRILDTLTIIEENNLQPKQPVNHVQKPAQKPVQQQKPTINKLSIEQQQYIATLSKEDQDAYIKLWS